DYLRDNLHHFIIKDVNFPLNPKEAIRKGFQAAENEFLTNYALDSFGEIADRSGSCAIVCLIVDNTIYISNVGDSRAVMSSNHGAAVTSLSEDHKPNDENETKRISEAGGRVYQ
ncbi:MAG: PP2C family serine/threonine-protein phosphatase, partial [Flammeovirgaceae bacterium]